MNHPSFWEQDSFFKPYDLIVVGAGIVGLSSALFYKRHQPGARILVIDKGFIPEGASTRNAGFACVGSITEHIADMAKESEQGIKERIKKRYDGLRLLRKTLGENNIGYEPCGGYELFTDIDRFKEARAQISHFNRRLKELTGEEEVYKADTLNGYNVIYNRLEGALHPGKMMQRWLQLATEEGIEVKWNCRADQIGSSGQLVLGSGTMLQARQVLVACNGFSRRLLPKIEVSPARGFVMVTKPIQNMPWKGTFHYDRGYIYFRNVGERLLLGGARNIAEKEEQTDNFGANPVIKKYLMHFISEELLPEREWEIEYEWSGIMGFTQSKTPVIKRINEYCAVAAGLSGMGVAIGTKVGESAAALLNGK